VLAWIGIAVAAAGAGRVHYDIDYHVEFLPREGQAVVTIAIDPHDAHVARIRLSMDPGRYTEARGDGRIARADDRETWEPPDAGGALHYRCRIDHRRCGGGYDAKIGPHWAIVRGDDLVLASPLVAEPAGPPPPTHA